MITPNLCFLLCKETSERDSGQHFSAQPQIKAYVPQVRNKSFSHPLIACDISSINVDHIGFSDPLHKHNFYCLEEDVKVLTRGIKTTDPKLSIIRHWPPNSNIQNATMESGDDRGSLLQQDYGSIQLGTQ